MMDGNTPIVTYGPWNEDEYAMFERRCPKCGRLDKADKLLRALGVSLAVGKASVPRVQQVSGAVEGMCCDCIYGGPCCDFGENSECEHRRKDGSCWTPYRVKLDRSRWKGCLFCVPDMDLYEDWGWLYCPICGRPLTREAWAELDERIKEL